MSLMKILAFATVIVMVTSSGFFVYQMLERNPDRAGMFWDNGGQHGQMVGVPGPVAGAGLPLLAVAGAYVWVRNRRRNR